MTLYDTFSVDGHRVAWVLPGDDSTADAPTSHEPNFEAKPTTDPDSVWSERVELRWDNEAWTATGELGHERATYVARLSPSFEIRQLLLFRDLDEPDLWIGTDGRGRWGEVNGSHRPELDGGTDIRVGDSIFSFGAIIRRLGLPVGASATVSIAQVDPETLGVVLGERTFERLDTHRWRVSTVGDTTGVGTVEFDVDDFGLPNELLGIAQQN